MLSFTRFLIRFPKKWSGACPGGCNDILGVCEVKLDCHDCDDWPGPLMVESLCTGGKCRLVLGKWKKPQDWLVQMRCDTGFMDLLQSLG